MAAISILKLHEADNVATVLRDHAPGEVLSVDGATLEVRSSIAAGHKIALDTIATGQAVMKFGFAIGLATAPIAPGEHVHTHNLETALSSTGRYTWQPGDTRALTATHRTWRGYAREDGRAGTRNEIWILPTVGCVGRTAQRIAALASRRHAGRVDGIYAFPHPFGCSQLGEDLSATRDILAALACNPNAGGVLVLGLGCESNQGKALLERIPAPRRPNVRLLAAQDAGDEVEAGLAQIDELVALAQEAQRSELPVSKLTIGLKCGGSDGFSGLTANPLAGRMADIVNGSGGRTILTEIPEMFGAEQILLKRAASRAEFDALAALVDHFKNYFTRHGEPVSENPSPGNIAGGITTLEEKSLGAVQKGGRAPLRDVLRYGETVRRDGLSVLEAPGNDAVSSTALAAAGATMVLFTTGRGTPLGFPVPTMKIASNSALAAHKPQWIDFDAGTVLERGMDIAADALFDRLIAHASGEETASERSDQREIAIWKRGVTL